jgi:tetratricopeptide (TPR) repeat protein
LGGGASRRYLVLLLLLAAVPGCSTRAQRLYRQAEASFAAQKYDLAAYDYTAIVRDSPNDPLADLALFKLAYLYREYYRDPAGAVKLYQRLVQQYPQSQLVGYALSYTVYIQARQLQDPVATLQTVQEMDEKIPEQPGLLARARLELAGAYLRSNQVGFAQQTLEQVIQSFPTETDAATEAYYRLALLYRDYLNQPQQATTMLEDLVNKDPDSAAAAKARAALGWAYYAQKGQEEQQRQEELKKLAKVLPGVPQLAPQSHPSLELLSGLQSLLAQAGATASFPDLMVVTGLAFQTAVDWDHPGKELYFARNPMIQVAEAWGFGYNAWTFGSAQEALLPLANSLAQNRPTLLLYRRRDPHWVLFVGYQPLEQQVYLLRPGQGKYSVVAAADFGAGWPAGAGAQIFSPLPATGYQFALTQPASQPAHVPMLKAALLRAVMELDHSDLSGAAAGRAGYEEIARRLAAAGTDPKAAAQAGKWAAAVAPMLVKARQAAGASLEAAAPEFPAEQQAAVHEAATKYNQFADRWQTLATSITAAAGTVPTADWKSLQDQAASLAADEQLTLRALSGTVGG